MDCQTRCQTLLRLCYRQHSLLYSAVYLRHETIIINTRIPLRHHLRRREMLSFAMLRRSPHLHAVLLLQLLLLLMLSAFVCPSVAQMSDDFLEFDMFEESRAGIYVINLMPNIELRHRYGVSDLRSLRFSFLTQPNLDRQYFAIDETSGEIRNTVSVDRETICPRMDDCVLKFDVVIQPIRYFQIIKVKVEIKDINDNAPAFPEALISHQISELAEIGTAFVVPAATDPDSRTNGIGGYDLLPRNGKFELSHRVTADGGTDLRLILRDRLDRETQEYHVVTVLAIDGGDPPQTGSIAVNITVQDANDNSPHFENSSYEIFVPESAAVDTVITRVKATDRDAGLNAAIVYEFSKHTRQEYGHLFGIKPESGKIYLKNSLDYETGSIYLLSVTANDRGPDNLPAHASLVVRVEDVNDHTPHISVNTLTTNNHAEVKENSEIGTFVAHLSVVDEDSGENGRILCAVDDRNFVLEPIYASELKLVTAARLDREQRGAYDLSISCKDYGRQPQSSVVPLQVKVTDENDHAPHFQKDYYETTVEENSDVGVTLFAVTATDRDDGPNGRVTYVTESRVERYIRLDVDTGIVTSAVSFDYEELRDLEFHLTASDQGTPPRAASTRMRLIVVDVDDQRPQFVADRFSFSVAENQAKWTEVGTVVAYDNDSDPFNSFVYQLETAGSPPEVVELFELDPTSGRLMARESLDRERKSVHHLTVYAAVVSGGGGGGPDAATAFSATAAVTVRVDDVNDNSPMFTRPSSGNETISVSAMTPKGHCITRLHAVDFDAGQNANLTYQLVSSSPPNLFRVVAATGDVIVSADLSRITMETVTLRLTVRDQGHPVALTDHGQLRVTISADIPFNVDRLLPLSILASEDMVVVLSFTLAVILLAIAVIVTVICIFRRRTRRTGRRYDGVAGGRSENGATTGSGSAVKGSDKMSVFDCPLAPPPPPSGGKVDGVVVEGKGHGGILDFLDSPGNANAVKSYVVQHSLDHCNTLLESIYADTVTARNGVGGGEKNDFQQVTEHRKPVVVFIRDQNEISRDSCISGNIFGSKERLHDSEQGFLGDRRRGYTTELPDSCHTLPLPLNRHRQTPYSAGAVAGTDRPFRDWARHHQNHQNHHQHHHHQQQQQQRVSHLYPGLRGGSTSNIGDLLADGPLPAPDSNGEAGTGNLGDLDIDGSRTRRDRGGGGGTGGTGGGVGMCGPFGSDRHLADSTNFRVRFSSSNLGMNDPRRNVASSSSSFYGGDGGNSSLQTAAEQSGAFETDARSSSS